MIDLNKWHHAIHQVTGQMATRVNRATPVDLFRWALALRTVAAEMEVECVGVAGQDQPPGDEAA
jgi:hypothetical protein